MKKQRKIIIRFPHFMELFFLQKQAGKEWDRCFWFWYLSKDDFQYCNFDLDLETGSATRHRCSPESFGEVVEYTGTSKTECTITVHNVSYSFETIRSSQGNKPGVQECRRINDKDAFV